MDNAQALNCFRAGMSDAAYYLLAFHSALPEHDEKGARLAIHEEEHYELEEALELGDREQIARELADVVFICYGSALVYGVDLDTALAAVAQANQAKIEGGRMNRKGKLEKPANFKAPSMKEALG